VFNVMNRPNYPNYVGVMTSPLFGRANTALPPGLSSCRTATVSEESGTDTTSQDSGPDISRPRIATNLEDGNGRVPSTGTELMVKPVINPENFSPSRK